MHSVVKKNNSPRRTRRNTEKKGETMKKNFITPMNKSNPNLECYSKSGRVTIWKFKFSVPLYALSGKKNLTTEEHGGKKGRL